MGFLDTLCEEYEEELNDNIYEDVADETLTEEFSKWIKKYIERNSDIHNEVHNICSYISKPTTLQFNVSTAILPVTIFSKSPVIIENIESKSIDPEDKRLNLISPYVLNDDNKYEVYTITEKAADNMIYINNIVNIDSVSFICNFESYNVLEKVLTFFLDRFPNIKFSVNYNSLVGKDDALTEVMRYREEHHRYVDIIFEDINRGIEDNIDDLY